VKEFFDRNDATQRSPGNSPHSLAMGWECLRWRVGEAWLLGYDRREIALRTDEVYRQLIQDGRQWILLSEADPGWFIPQFIAACAAGCQVCLGNPDWGDREWQQAKVLLSRPPHTDPAPLSPPSPLAPLILIPTGGTSGQIRFAMHTWETLTASVQGFQQYFAVDQINSICVLRLYHVSGLMQLLRSLLSGGNLWIQPFKTLESGNTPDLAPEEFFLSLVPTQLQRLLRVSNPGQLDWLRRLRAIFLGGAPAWDGLLDQARDLNLPLAPTYGMTETAAQIATLQPTAFRAGETGCGAILPHAQVTIRDAQGNPLPPNQPGSVTLRAASLALGYYPQWFETADFWTDDLGYLSDRGNLHIIGRASDKIITGGEKVFPAEVEAAIRATGLVQDVVIVGVEDGDWGQAIAAVYVPQCLDHSPERLKLALEDQVTRWKIPKYWLAVAAIPRNPQGKVNRAAIATLIKTIG